LGIFSPVICSSTSSLW